MKNPEVYFVGGVSGVGKTSTLAHLKTLLPPHDYDVRDFDERGVPDGGGLEWHNNETLAWLNIASENAAHGKSTVVCGFVHPQRLKALHSKTHPPMRLFLLNASAQTIRERLMKRYQTAESLTELRRAARATLEEFVQNNTLFAPELVDLFKAGDHPIIETDTKKPEEVAKEITALILGTSDPRAER